jgi:phage-related protein
VAHGLRLEKVQAHITELKVSWNRQEFRFLFFNQQQSIFIVNFFQKKTQKTPGSEIALAVARMREIQLGTAKPASGSIH